MKNCLPFIAIRFTEEDTVAEIVYLTASSPIDLFWKLDFFGDPNMYEFKPIDHIAISFDGGVYDDELEDISQNPKVDIMTEEEFMARPMPQTEIDDCSGDNGRFAGAVWFKREELYAMHELFESHVIINYDDRASIKTQNDDIRLGWIGTPFEEYAETRMPLLG